MGLRFWAKVNAVYTGQTAKAVCCFLYGVLSAAQGGHQGAGRNDLREGVAEGDKGEFFFVFLGKPIIKSYEKSPFPPCFHFPLRDVGLCCRVQRA